MSRPCLSSSRSSGVLSSVIALAALALPLSAQFSERSTEVGLVHETIGGLDQIGGITVMRDWVQTGIALGDLTGDGRVDVVACGRFAGTRTWQNLGTSFLDVSAASGLHTGDLANCVTLGDHDGDGDLDVFLGVQSPYEGPVPSANRLAANDGTGVFSDRTDALDGRGGGHTVFAKFFDLDVDGDLDLYVAEFNGTNNQVQINDGTGNYAERGQELGAITGGSTHVLGFADTDGDGWGDILIGNDWLVSNAGMMVNNSEDAHLHGNGDGSFTDVTAGAGFDLSMGPTFGAGTMGLTFGDVNYDGLLDVFRTEAQDQVLVLNHGWPNGSPWVQVQDQYGVASPLVPDPANPGSFGTTVGWGAKFFHANHDEWIDLFHVAGQVASGQPRGQRNFLYAGVPPTDGTRLQDVTAQSGLYDEYDDRGIAVGDVDDDGDMDILVSPPGGSLRFFANDAASGTTRGWLKVYAETRSSAPGGYGTVVRYTDANGFPHTVPINVDGTTAGMNEAVAHFGLGTAQTVDLEVEFPSGLTRYLPGTGRNQSITVVEPELVRVSTTKLSAGAPGAGPVTGGGSGPWTPASPAIVGDGTGVSYAPAPSGSTPGDVGAAVVVTAFAHAADGTPLDGTALVTIDAPGLEAVGPVEHVSGNRFQRGFRRAPQAGSHRVQVGFDGWTPRVRPTVTFTGPPAVQSTGVRLAPVAVRANSGDPFEVTVVPRDASGVALGSGREVRVSLPTAGIAALPLTDLGDGRYRVALGVPLAAGEHDVLVDVNDVSLGALAALDVGESVVAATSPLHVGDPTKEIAQRPHQLKLRLVPRDAAKRRLGPAATPTLSFIPDPGSEAVVERVELFRTLEDGSYCFVVERAPDTAPDSASGLFRIHIDGLLAAEKAYEF